MNIKQYIFLFFLCFIVVLHHVAAEYPTHPLSIFCEDGILIPPFNKNVYNYKVEATHKYSRLRFGVSFDSKDYEGLVLPKIQANENIQQVTSSPVEVKMEINKSSWQGKLKLKIINPFNEAEHTDYTIESDLSNLPSPNGVKEIKIISSEKPSTTYTFTPNISPLVTEYSVLVPSTETNLEIDFECEGSATKAYDENYHLFSQGSKTITLNTQDVSTSIPLLCYNPSEEAPTTTILKIHSYNDNITESPTSYIPTFIAPYSGGPCHLETNESSSTLFSKVWISCPDVVPHPQDGKPDNLRFKISTTPKNNGIAYLIQYSSNKKSRLYDKILSKPLPRSSSYNLIMQYYSSKGALEEISIPIYIGEADRPEAIKSSVVVPVVLAEAEKEAAVTPSWLTLFFYGVLLFSFLLYTCNGLQSNSTCNNSLHTIIRSCQLCYVICCVRSISMEDKFLSQIVSLFQPLMLHFDNTAFSSLMSSSLLSSPLLTYSTVRYSVIIIMELLFSLTLVSLLCYLALALYCRYAVKTLWNSGGRRMHLQYILDMSHGSLFGKMPLLALDFLIIPLAFGGIVLFLHRDPQDTVLFAFALALSFVSPLITLTRLLFVVRKGDVIYQVHGDDFQQAIQKTEDKWRHTRVDNTIQRLLAFGDKESAASKASMELEHLPGSKEEKCRRRLELIRSLRKCDGQWTDACCDHVTSLPLQHTLFSRRALAKNVIPTNSQGANIAEEKTEWSTISQESPEICGIQKKQLYHKEEGKTNSIMHVATYSLVEVTVLSLVLSPSITPERPFSCVGVLSTDWLDLILSRTSLKHLFYSFGGAVAMEKTDSHSLNRFSWRVRKEVNGEVVTLSPEEDIKEIDYDSYMERSYSLSREGEGSWRSFMRLLQQKIFFFLKPRPTIDTYQSIEMIDRGPLNTILEEEDEEDMDDTLSNLSSLRIRNRRDEGEQGRKLRGGTVTMGGEVVYGRAPFLTLTCHSSQLQGPITNGLLSRHFRGMKDPYFRVIDTCFLLATSTMLLLLPSKLPSLIWALLILLQVGMLAYMMKHLGPYQRFLDNAIAFVTHFFFALVYLLSAIKTEEEIALAPIIVWICMLMTGSVLMLFASVSYSYIFSLRLPSFDLFVSPFWRYFSPLWEKKEGPASLLTAVHLKGKDTDISPLSVDNALKVLSPSPAFSVVAPNTSRNINGSSLQHQAQYNKLNSRDIDAGINETAQLQTNGTKASDAGQEGVGETNQEECISVDEENELSIQNEREDWNCIALGVAKIPIDEIHLEPCHDGQKIKLFEFPVTRETHGAIVDPNNPYAALVSIKEGFVEEKLCTYPLHVRDLRHALQGIPVVYTRDNERKDLYNSFITRNLESSLNDLSISLEEERKKSLSLVASEAATQGEEGIAQPIRDEYFVQYYLPRLRIPDALMSVANDKEEGQTLVKFSYELSHKKIEPAVFEYIKNVPSMENYALSISQGVRYHMERTKEYRSLKYFYILPPTIPEPPPRRGSKQYQPTEALNEITQEKDILMQGLL